MSEFKEYLGTLTKEELINIIIGDEDRPPILTRNEKGYSRPQMIWSLNKLNNGDFKKNENTINSMISIIEGYRWDKFYNYNYLRFDIRKPSFYIVLIIIGFTFFAIGHFIAHLI